MQVFEGPTSYNVHPTVKLKLRTLGTVIIGNSISTYYNLLFEHTNYPEDSSVTANQRYQASHYSFGNPMITAVLCLKKNMTVFK